MRKLLVILFLFTPGLLFAQGKSVKKLNKQQIQSLTVLGELWGFLKYYHPVVTKKNLDWDSVLLAKMPLFIKQSKSGLNGNTNDWINELGNVDRCSTCENNLPDSFKYNLDFSWIETSGFAPAIKNRLYFIRDNRNQGNNKYVEYERSFVKIINEKSYQPYRTFQYPAPEYRLLLLFRYWNIINYFSPNKYLNGKNWKDVLKEKIEEFYEAKDTLSYHLSYLKLIASLNDGHSVVSITPTLENYFGKYYWVPFGCKRINGLFIVSKIYNDSISNLIDIKVGDIIKETDGEKAENKWKRIAPFISASNSYDKEQNFVESYLFRAKNRRVTVKKIRDGKEITTAFPLPEKSILSHLNIHPWRMVRDSIGYIDMNNLEKVQVDSVMMEFKKTKGIIIDIRGYPKNTWTLIADYLCAAPFKAVKTSFPSLNYPGVFKFLNNAWYGRKNADPYTGKVVLLVDESSQSHAEFSAIGLQAATRTVTIGSTTAGADGDVTSLIELPGGFIMRFSGLGVYYPDGTATQRAGVKIDIKIRPTIKGLQQGRDEVLERAIWYLESGE